MRKLPKLKPDKDFPNDLVGHIRLFTGRVGVSVSITAETESEQLKYASESIQKLDDLSSKAKEAATSSLLATYNEDWRLPDSDPLSEHGFANRLRLKDVEFEKRPRISLWFDDSNMFGGHSILVTFQDGLEFKNITASLFG